MRAHRMVMAGVALALLTGCGTPAGDEPTDSASPSGSQSTQAPADGANGSVYTSAYADGTTTLTRFAVNSDGSVGEGTTLMSAASDEVDFPGVIDGVGSSVLTGSFSQYWTTDLQVRVADTGAVSTEVAAPNWCGGEGLTYNVCVQLDEARLARTSDLGGEGVVDGTIYVSSLQGGEDLATLGPFPGLYDVLGTSDPNTLIILAASTPNTDPPEPRPGTVLALDVASGATTEIGTYPEGWAPLCAIGTDSVLGYTLPGTATATVVGTATIGAATWAEDDTPVGCSADGAFVFVQNIPQPPTEETDDNEAPNPSTTLDRISLADGARESVATLTTGEWATKATR